MNALLLLEDGSVMRGRAIGKLGTAGGEVVFNTGMTGYQEVLTDPSYRGQIVVMTYPLIGNYGVNLEDVESPSPHTRGLVVRELCRQPSNWRSQESLASYMERHGLVGIEGVDTRALTRKLRDVGTMRGLIAPEGESVEALLEQVRRLPTLSEQDLVSEVTSREAYTFAEGERANVIVIDYGSKGNILRSLAAKGCRVHVVPADATAESVMALHPDGVVLSNGPGDPQRLPYAHELATALVGKVPVFGVCLGHQLLALGLGGTTFKLKYGHRGANHPVKDLETGRTYITSQNHGYAVASEGLEAHDIVVTHTNLNDGTVEGIRHKHLPVFAVQFHPEASPGPGDSAYLFDRFLDLVDRTA